MRVAAIVGESGSGKTTLIVALIRHFVTSGQSVAAIKHTHHPLNNDRRGDTAAFEAAGASAVIFARDGEAIAGGKRVRFESPRDLLDHIDADVVLVEGFKQFDAWPRIELDRNSRVSVEDALSILDRMWASK